jgi:hypothetical protein
MKPETPALRRVRTSTNSTIWVAANDATATGTNRANRLPAWPRSHCLSGAGSSFDRAATMRGVGIIGVLESRDVPAISLEITVRERIETPEVRPGLNRTA